MHSNVKLRNPIPQYERLPWKQRNVAQSPDPGSPTCARSGVSAGEAGLVFSQGWLMTWEKMEGDESSDFHRDLLGFQHQKISNSWCGFFLSQRLMVGTMKTLTQKPPRLPWRPWRAPLECFTASRVESLWLHGEIGKTIGKRRIAWWVSQQNSGPAS